MNKVIKGEIDLLDKAKNLSYKEGEKMTVVGTDYSLGTSESIER